MLKFHRKNYLSHSPLFGKILPKHMCYKNFTKKLHANVYEIDAPCLHHCHPDDKKRKEINQSKRKNGRDNDS
jgi:hypothetical protein